MERLRSAALPLDYDGINMKTALATERVQKRPDIKYVRTAEENFF